MKQNKGTLFIIKREYHFFDDSHRHMSNDLEIELVDAGLLQLYKGLK